MANANIQFSVGVHIMQVLHVYADRKITSAFLTESVNADGGSVRLVLSKLAKAGLVCTARGRNGSSSLARPAHRITLLDILRATGGPDVFAVHPHAIAKQCMVSIHHKDVMTQVLHQCQDAFEASLAKKKLSDVVAPMQ